MWAWSRGRSAIWSASSGMRIGHIKRGCGGGCDDAEFGLEERLLGRSSRTLRMRGIAEGFLGFGLREVAADRNRMLLLGSAGVLVLVCVHDVRAWWNIDTAVGPLSDHFYRSWDARRSGLDPKM